MARLDHVRVLVAGPGRHIFEGLGGRPVQLHHLSVAHRVEPDVIVLPCGQHQDVVEIAAGIPAAIWARAAARQAVVVFDSSSEGHQHYPETTEMLHGLVQGLGVSPSVCSYLTQDRGYREDYLRFCASVDHTEPMQVLNYDYWIRRFLTERPADGDGLFEARREAFERRSSRRERRFISLNLTARPAKVLFLLKLMHEGLWDEGFISFGGFEYAKPDSPNPVRKLRKQILALPGFRDIFREVAPGLDELDAMGHVMFGELDYAESGRRFRNIPFGDSLGDEYARSWFTIVPETEMRDRPARITEKPFKALVNFHPVIVLGNPGSLKLIKSFGFRTFEGFFDESYDEELDPRKRFDLVYSEVARLCAMEEDMLARLEAGIAETLTYNARWGLTQLPQIYRERIDADLLDGILGPLETTSTP